MPTIRIDSTEAKQDGSGNVTFDAFVVDDEGFVVKHASVDCPYAEVQDVLNTSGAAAKIQALAAMLKRNFTGFSDEQVMQEILNNTNARTVDTDFDALVDSQNGYPFEFDLSP